ncbi:MAG TPA: LamG domain-containing protein [Labilithrix sp.]|nr:LamG domain-containing protein [Labilithrix sp.]
MQRLASSLVVALAVVGAAGACSLTTSLEGYAGPALSGGDGAAADASPEGAALPDARADAADAADAAGSRYRAAVLADSPLAYYRLDDTGDIARDELGAHDGHIKGTLAATAGALAGDANRAAAFDGASFVEIGDVFPFLGTASFSIEAWARPLAPASDPGCMVAKNVPTDGGSVADGYALFLESDSNQVTQARFHDSVEDGATGPVIEAGKFAHVVSTYDGTTIRLYVDGEKVTELTSTSNLAVVPRPLTLGASRGGAYCYFRGALDEIAIYGSALPGDRIRAHHDAGLGK